MAQKLAPAEKNSTDISAASAAFCISGIKISLSIQNSVVYILWAQIVCKETKNIKAAPGGWRESTQNDMSTEQVQCGDIRGEQ